MGRMVFELKFSEATTPGVWYGRVSVEKRRQQACLNGSLAMLERAFSLCCNGN